MVDTGKDRLLDQVRAKTRLLHMSKRTEEAYVYWIVDFLRYHFRINGNWIHPAQLGNVQIN